MDVADGCQYLGCEDVATRRRVVHDVDAAAETALCRGHHVFVIASCADPARRIVLVEDAENRLRVKVLLPTRTVRVTATPIESDRPDRHVDKDVERWIRRLLETRHEPSMATP
jgi:hypothetical protein